MNRRSKLGPQVLSFYRKTIKAIYRLEESHQRIWYDYLRLKLQENAHVRDDRNVKKLLAAGHEEVDWVITVLDRKKN